MATPMSASLQGRPVVDAVAGHRHDVAAGLQRPGDPQLVLRRDPADHDAVAVQQRAEDVRRPPGRSVPSSTSSGEPIRPISPGDRGRGDGVVAGDHGDLDAGAAAGLRAPADVGPGRVLQADQPQQRPAPVQPRRPDAVAGQARQAPLGHRDHAQPGEAICSTFSWARPPGSAPHSGSTDSGAPLTNSVVPTMADSRRRRGSKAKRCDTSGIGLRAPDRPAGRPGRPWRPPSGPPRRPTALVEHRPAHGGGQRGGAEVPRLPGSGP